MIAAPSLVAVLLLVASNALAAARVYVPSGCASPGADASDAGLLACFAPVVEAPDAERPWNRIGTPVVSRGALGGLDVAVDPDRPALFGEARTDFVGERVVVQLVYRMHFQKIPLRLSHLFYEAHDNPGLLAIVTLDARSLAPLFVTTVHTCGCYRAVQPTRAVPDAVLPSGWPPDEIAVYGQRLPARLVVPAPGERLVLRLAADDHRIRDARFARALPDGERVDLPVVPMHELRHAPVSGGDGERASIFYASGPLRGHVRDAWNPLEGLTVFGWVALDPTVGMDKDFGDPAETGTPFYTSIAFWHQEESRLDRFDRLLRSLGFRTEAFPPGPD